MNETLKNWAMFWLQKSKMQVSSTPIKIGIWFIGLESQTFCLNYKDLNAFIYILANVLILKFWKLNIDKKEL